MIKLIVITVSRTSRRHSCPVGFGLLECHPVFLSTAHVDDIGQKGSSGDREQRQREAGWRATILQGSANCLNFSHWQNINNHEKLGPECLRGSPRGAISWSFLMAEMKKAHLPLSGSSPSTKELESLWEVCYTGSHTWCLWKLILFKLTGISLTGTPLTAELLKENSLLWPSWESLESPSFSLLCQFCTCVVLWPSPCNRSHYFLTFTNFHSFCYSSYDRYICYT